MKLLTTKDKDLRRKLFSSEARDIQLKYLRANLLNSPKFKRHRNAYRYYFNKKLKTRVSKTKLVRRCLLTYKARVMHKKFKISRVKLKKLLDFNLVAGYKKAIW
jgi:ribosomal protein S14